MAQTSEVAFSPARFNGAYKVRQQTTEGEAEMERQRRVKFSVDDTKRR
jgi:hypothetical protein